MDESKAYARFPHLTASEIGIRHAWATRRRQAGNAALDSWELNRLRVEFKARRARVRGRFPTDDSLRRELLHQQDPARWWDAKTFGRCRGEPPELWLGSRHWSIAELETFVDHAGPAERGFATDLESSHEATIRRTVMETDAAREVRSAFLQSEGFYEPVSGSLPSELRERLMKALVGVQERFDELVGPTDPLTVHRVDELLREAFVDAREAQIDAWNVTLAQHTSLDPSTPFVGRMEEAIVQASKELVDARLPGSPVVARALDRAVDAAGEDFRRAKDPDLREQAALAVERAENAAYSVSRLADRSQLVDRARDVRDAQAALGEAYGVARIWDRARGVRRAELVERLRLATETAPTRVFRRLSQLTPQGRFLATAIQSLGRSLAPRQRPSLELVR